MKNKKNKLLIIILSVVVGLVIVGGATIGSLVIFHKHSYSTEWVYDESCHWHNATCSHKEEISDKGEHEWVKGTEVAPTCTAQGYTNYSCSVCGATKKADYTEISETHHASNSWSNNEENHWHNCTFCDAKIGMDEHTIESTWQIDDTTGTHWQNCSVCGGKQELAEHTLVKDYSVVTSSDDGSISSVTTTERCTLCAKTYTPVTLETSDYVVLTPEETRVNIGTETEPNYVYRYTFTDDNKVYILNGTFNNTQFTFDAENVTVVGSGATTAGLGFSYTENADNSVVYGCTFNGTTVLHGDLMVVNCVINGGTTYNFKKDNLNIVVDSCLFGNYNDGLRFNYGYQDGDNVVGNFANVTITNNTFLYSNFPIMLVGNPSGSVCLGEIGKVEIVNNTAVEGWGGDKDKRAFLKVNTDRNLAPIDHDSDVLTDTSLLTESARKLAKRVLLMNTLNKNGKKCCMLNFGDVHFDTLD